MVKIRNKKNGAESEVTDQQWQKMQASKAWKYVFELVHQVQEPPEVTALKNKKTKQ